MTRSVNVWNCFIIFGYILQPVYTGTTYTSKACYGSGGNDCTRHDVSCNSTKKIAICDAYYTNNTECTQIGLSSCDSFSADGVAEYGYHRFNNTELVSLDNNCSTKSQCVFKGPRRGGTRTFSVVKYQCIEGTTYTSKACYGVDGLDCTRHEISCNSTQKIAIYDAYFTNNTECGVGVAICLDVKPDNVIEHGYHRFNSTELVSLYNTCSTMSRCVYVAPRRSAVRAFSVVKYWCIEASDPFDVRCEPVASTGGFTTESTNDRSPAFTLSKIPKEMTTWPNKDEPPISTPSRFPPGVFMGGVAAGAVVVILVGLAVYVLVIRRRYDLTAKKQGDKPASVEHPTYSGLSAEADVNNYTDLEPTSTSQEDTTHGSTATPDYQNI